MGIPWDTEKPVLAAFSLLGFLLTYSTLPWFVEGMWNIFES